MRPQSRAEQTKITRALNARGDAARRGNRTGNPAPWDLNLTARWADKIGGACEKGNHNTHTKMAKSKKNKIKSAMRRRGRGWTLLNKSLKKKRGKEIMSLGKIGWK